MFCSYGIWVAFSLYSFVGLLCLIIHGIMLPRAQESLPSMNLFVLGVVTLTLSDFNYLLSCTDMLLQRCHFLLRHFYSFMLVWMPWTLKNGDLSVIGTFCVLLKHYFLTIEKRFMCKILISSADQEHLLLWVQYYWL